MTTETELPSGYHRCVQCRGSGVSLSTAAQCHECATLREAWHVGYNAGRE